MSYFEPPRPGVALLSFGVILPATALAMELATGLCASAFFDPIPTGGHALVVAAVPAVNYALWRAARRDEPGSPWLTAAAGAAMTIALAYALVFLPLVPIALVAIILVGFGLLPLSPALALIASAKLAGRFAGDEGHGPGRLFGGVLAGLAALVLVDLPATATYVAVGWAGEGGAKARRGAALMRAAGDEKMLLRLCYGEGGRATGLGSFIVASWNEGRIAPRAGPTTAMARELYYRTTGTPFNAVERPARGRSDWLWGFDEDRGGTAVGGRIDGLRLAESRLDGSVAAADNLAYLEWTAAFANRSADPQEARLTLALPPGAVASRATLWVNGVPREASIAGRGEARAAYENVVRQSRDPLLVTTDGSGRLLVQAFPVPAGGSLKLRIGMTAPLDIGRDGARSFVLPAIAARNFELPADLRHQVWIEGDGALAARYPSLETRALESGAAQVRGAIGDDELARRRPRILVARVAAPAVRTALVPATANAPALRIEQRVVRARSTRPAGLVIVLDASAANRGTATGLGRALDALPAGLPVGLFVAAEPPREVTAAPWSPEQRARIRQALADTVFSGGQDNLAALAEALGASAGRDSTLLWIHGPQPVEFVGSSGRLNQILERSTGLPRLVRYQAEPGPAFAVAGHPWFESAREIPPTGDAGADLARLIAELAGGDGWQVIRSQTPGAGGPASSIHIARLWGAGELATAARAQGKERSRAIDLAHRLNIVTPVSGAVVLETDAEYKNSGLAVPGSADVPTVPEPATWALIAIVGALLLWQVRRRRWVLA